MTCAGKCTRNYALYCTTGNLAFFPVSEPSINRISVGCMEHLGKGSETRSSYKAGPQVLESKYQQLGDGITGVVNRVLIHFQDL